MFIAIAFPPTFLGALIGFRKLTDASFYSGEPHKYMSTIYLFRMPYALVAIIDPFLYTASNSTVKKKMKRTFKTVCSAHPGRVFRAL